ncbi:D-alanyl-D-alanine carboxypeptidase [Sporichthya sp.]|uniref:D-alanyl-D-alanine carboxypeptidase family protein n=1 Tax=Sporichthya sp. TaxID=65475 RepID=UPI0017B0833F|nr:D-alanyl-D-alanine carboxypeptidase [Sporichthya sp.]MBA3742553.1 D-alanyl-D-alanine carboxypeptidase [Sporichthya sp.]
MRHRTVAVFGVVIGALLPATAMASTPEPIPGASTSTSTPSTTDAGSVVGGPRLAETGFVTAPGAPALPATSAAAWVLADADTGEVLAARDPHRKLRPASTLKTLLALTMAPRVDVTDTYVADREDAEQEGTRVGLWPGHTYRVDDLWYALLLKSGNDAATALAKAGGGTLERGLAMMQAEARRLQANDTTVVTPSGLDADGQFASAYDLALWGRAALSRGDLRHYISTIRHSFHALSVPADSPFTDETMYVRTENRLMLNDFPGAIGVKMGYTTKAQNTMIAAAERDGRTIVATLMFTPGGRITSDAAALLEYGFANAGRIEPVGQLVEPLSAAVVSDVDADPAIGVSTNEAPPASSGADAQDLLVGGVPLGWSAMTGGLVTATLLGLLTGWTLKRRRRLARAGVYR